MYSIVANNANTTYCGNFSQVHNHIKKFRQDYQSRISISHSSIPDRLEISITG